MSQAGDGGCLRPCRFGCWQVLGEPAKNPENPAIIKRMLALNPTVNPEPKLPLGTYTTNLAVFLLPALALTVPSGYSLGALILLAAGSSLIARRSLPALSRQDSLIVLVLLTFAAVGVVEAILDNQGISGIDKPLRFIFAIPALIWLIKYPPNTRFLWSGMATGGVLAASFALWQRVFENMERAQGYTHPIQFGNLSMLMGVLCLAGLGWAAVQPRYRSVWLAILLAGALGGVLGSLLSGSRGGWVGLPLVLWVFYRGYGRHLGMHLKVALLALLLAGAATVYAVPQLGVQARVNEAVSDVHQYISGESRATSVGARFDMWRGAAMLIAEKPLTGWGSQGYAEAMHALGENGVIDPYAAQFEHAHNEFVDAQAKRGLAGIVVLLALYLIPMRLFYQGFEAPIGQRAVAVAGVLLPVTYMDFGLTQAFLTHNSGIMMYAFLLAVLWGSYRQQQPLRVAR